MFIYQSIFKFNINSLRNRRVTVNSTYNQSYMQNSKHFTRCPIRRCAHSLCRLSLLMMLIASTGYAADISESELQRLQSGEILVQTIHEEKSGGAARVTGLFHADADTVWNVIG